MKIVHITNVYVPNLGYQYMAMGKPVIASRLSGLVKEFGEENGVLYIDQPEELLNLTTTLISNNAIETEQSGRKAFSFVEGNDWMKLTESFEKLLDSLTNNVFTEKPVNAKPVHEKPVNEKPVNIGGQRYVSR